VATCNSWKRDFQDYPPSADNYFVGNRFRPRRPCSTPTCLVGFEDTDSQVLIGPESQASDASASPLAGVRTLLHANARRMHGLEPKTRQWIEGEPPLGFGVASDTFWRGRIHRSDNSCIARTSKQESAYPKGDQAYPQNVKNENCCQRPPALFFSGTFQYKQHCRGRCGAVAMRILHVMAFQHLLRMH
jgi:hypothetical protein